jgi:hypothetical protein
MKRFFGLGSVLFVMACGQAPETVVVDLDPVDASASIQVFVTNDTGEIIIEGEAGRTTVEVEATFNGGVQADYDQVTLVSEPDGNTVSVNLDVPSNLPNVIGDLRILVPDTFGANVTGNLTIVSVSNLIGGAIIRVDAGDVACEDVTGGISVESNAADVVINTAMNQGDTITVDTDIQGEIELTLPADTNADFIAASGSGELAIGAALNFTGNNADGVADGIFNAGGAGQTEIDLFTQSGAITILAQ